MLMIALGIVGVLALAALMTGAWHLMRCVHAWEFVDKTELPAGMEELRKSGAESMHLWPSDIVKLCSKKVIIVIRCPKCGASKVIRES